MNRLWWIVSFVVGAPTLLVSAFILLALQLKINSPKQVTSKPMVLAASIPVLSSSRQNNSSISMEFETTDARAIVVKEYLHKYKSPLEPFARQEVEISDKYNLDWRLLIAIAQQESNLCKKIPVDSHNCWGFGIYGNLVTRFDSYIIAMETVAKTLKKNYIDKGLVTTEEIMAKYTPPSKGSWAKGVNQFLAELE